MMKLERPLFCFDLETTSVNVKEARVVQMGMRKLVPYGNEPKLEYAGCEIFDPQVRIPEDAIKVHGITNEMVKGKRLFRDIATQVFESMKDCDFFGYNVKYDLNVMVHEFECHGLKFDFTKAKIVDPFRIWQQLEKKDLSTAVKRWAPDHEFKAHDAEDDILATCAVFEGMLHLVPQGEFPDDVKMLFENPTVEDMHVFAFPGQLDSQGCFILKNGVIHLNFGKNKGEPAHKCVPYLKWMVGKNFAADTLHIARKIIQENQ